MKGVVSDVVTMILSVDWQSSAMTLIDFANKKVVILPPMIANLCRSTTFVAKTKTFAGDVPITKTNVDKGTLSEEGAERRWVYVKIQLYINNGIIEL